MSESPAPVTRLYCPLTRCPWTYDDPGPDTAAAFGADPVALMTAHTMNLEGTIREHLETHPPTEWAREVQQLRSKRDAETEGASALVAVMLRRLGGSADFTEGEIASEHHTLHREPTAHGFRLVVTA